MKRRTLITLSICLYFVLAGLAIVVTKHYVDKKEDRLYSEAINNLEDFFAHQDKFVNIDYSGKKVAYEKSSIPKYNALEYKYSWNAYEDKEIWNEMWGDVYKLYKLKPRYEGDSWSGTDNEWTGWQFTMVEKNSYDGFNESIIYPYEVAVKKQEEAWYYNYVPSVQTAIDESFEFHTENEKSSYKNYLTRGNHISAYDVIRRVDNQYFIAFSYDHRSRIFGKETLDSLIYAKSPKAMSKRKFMWKKIEERDIRYYGGMHNGYYKVNNRIQPVSCYIINYDIFNDPKRDDFNKIILISELVLLSLMLLLVILLSRKERNHRKDLTESVKQKLLRLCNPNQFMKPYDEKKIALANDLYEKILETSEDDENELKALRKEAIISLGINFINSELLEELRCKTNPQKYMKPYDHEKVRVANSLHTKLLNDNLTIDEFEEIQLMIKDKL